MLGHANKQRNNPGTGELAQSYPEATTKGTHFRAMFFIKLFLSLSGREHIPLQHPIPVAMYTCCTSFIHINESDHYTMLSHSPGTWYEDRTGTNNSWGEMNGTKVYLCVLHLLHYVSDVVLFQVLSKALISDYSL